MSLFQCEECGCFDNTALARSHSTKNFPEWFDWTGIEDRKGKTLCSACAPSKFADGSGGEEGTGRGKWHGQFDRVFLPLGEFETDREGNLRHTQTNMLLNDWREAKAKEGE